MVVDRLKGPRNQVPPSGLIASRVGCASTMTSSVTEFCPPYPWSPQACTSLPSDRISVWDCTCVECHRLAAALSSWQTALPTAQWSCRVRRCCGTRYVPTDAGPCGSIFFGPFALEPKHLPHLFACILSYWDDALSDAQRTRDGSSFIDVL